MKRGIVSYDITINRFRTRLSKLLSGFGSRVQFSVFEFNLEDKLYEEMLKKVEKMYKDYICFAYKKGNIDDIKRNIRIYIICEGCYRKTIILDKNKKAKKIGMII